nr:MAG TPA: CRISPR-associated endonuclease [Caudoviricetes sp.]
MSLSDALEKMANYVTGSKDPQLLGAVMEVQRELIEIQEENRNLRQRIIELENLEIVSSELKYRANCYYRDGTGPFCTKCFDDDGKLIRMTVEEDFNTAYVVGICPKCKSKVKTDIPFAAYNDVFSAVKAYLENLRNETSL